MELTCTQENLKKAILSVERVTSKQISLPILKNILMETKNGRLILSATNLEIGIVCNVGAKIKKEGSIAVPAKLLSDFILNLPQENNIEIKSNNQLLKINCGKYKAIINCFDSSDFPIIPKEKNKHQFSIDNNIFKDIINKSLICTSLNDTRIEFTGINIIFESDDIYIASTDSFRLMEYKLNIKKSERFGDLVNKSIIIPSETLREVGKIINNNENIKQTLVFIEDNQIFFNINDIKVVSRLINGKYPDYKQIIPVDFKTEIIINRNEVLKSIKIASVFTRIKEGEIRLDIKNDKLIVKSESLETGENETEVDIDKKGDDQEIILNPRYLIDSLNTIDSEKISIGINNGESPMGIRMINNKDEILKEYIYIIMPIKK
ncbi:MAG: DNA polymerase III subunit beta [Candidatus Moranbacteria bacterium]|jgi:DNA polymerase-3 subunit beta|nr:DNA polymerase III subunit beta [Candidatus Moranbacteria bacterium]MDX9855584.1 DNA polymerase III subunit beta [Candidatus Moranbacteria bacterium]